MKEKRAFLFVWPPVNGVRVVRANVEADYGIVHVIDGLMDGVRLTDACRSQRARLWPGQPDDEPARRISSRKVSQHAFSSANDINDEAPVPAVVVPQLDEDK